MRIPFIPRVSEPNDLGVDDARFRFITETRGGSAFLLAGGAFWLVGAVVSLIAPDTRVEWVLYGGLAIPVVAAGIARLQGARLFTHAGYAALAAFATLTELTALPTMLFMRSEHPEVLPGVLIVADGAHLLILMWLHLDYTYFLAANAKVVLGTLFIFGVLWPGSYPAQMMASGLISVAAALLVWRDSRRTVQLYLLTPTMRSGPAR